MMVMHSFNGYSSKMKGTTQKVLEVCWGLEILLQSQKPLLECTQQGRNQILPFLHFELWQTMKRDNNNLRKKSKWRWEGRLGRLLMGCVWRPFVLICLCTFVQHLVLHLCSTLHFIFCRVEFISHMVFCMITEESRFQEIPSIRV